MNQKIAHLQQRNAQACLRQRYAFLNIADIQSQHQAARAEMVRRIRALVADTAWISLSENGFGFWARISLPALQAALDHWFEQYNDFGLYLENGYALAIHEAEYEWELLETPGRPLEAT